MESKIKALMTDWDFDKAVAIANPIARDFEKRTVQMAQILYIANQKLSNQGFRSDLIECNENITTFCQMAESNSHLHTFEEFCESIKIPYRTAKRWIDCYDPDKDYLLTQKEYTEAKKLELDTFYEDITEMRETDPGYVPKDIDLKWSRKFKWSETQYQKWLTARNFSPSSKDIEPAFISRDAKIQEFGLWNTEFILDLQQKCQDITHDKAERFADYVAAYKEATPSGITSRELMRIPVIVEAVLSPLSPEGKKKCLGMLSMFFAQDGWNSDDWLKEVR